jgi:hypothetical protein
LVKSERLGLTGKVKAIVCRSQELLLGGRLPRLRSET